MVDLAPKKRTGRRSWWTSFTSTSRIILFWYTLVTIAFRCPSSPSEVTDNSPWMCKPYFELREQVAPYITPYYNGYAAPYVDKFVTPYVETIVTSNAEKLRPYADNFHATIYTPIRKRALKVYNNYGATRISQVLLYCDREWEAKVVPYLDQYAAQARQQYELHLKPYVSMVIKPIYPHLHRTRDIAVKQYYETFLPLYSRSLPHAQLAYDRSRQLVVNVAIPYSTWVINKVTGFMGRKVLPTIRILYGQNVEPQLSKISERLSSYWDARKLEAAVIAGDNEEDRPSTPLDTPSSTIDTESQTSMPTSSSAPPTVSSSNTPEPDTSVNSVAESESQFAAATESHGILGSILSMVTATTDPVAASVSRDIKPETTDEAVPTAIPTSEKVTDELKRWQTKFKLAADKGADDLSERVTQITKRQIEGQVRSVGEALVLQLEEASQDSIQTLKVAVNKAIRDLPEDATENIMQESIESVWQSIRSAGKDLKEKAQELRSWKARFDINTDALVEAASRSTLNVIDSIRDLGLQEIGLRWASMDSVTYQDWAEYHNLKETFDGWREQVLKVATDHEGLVAAKREADDIEGQGMAVAENAAKELARLKDAASWKIHAKDSSDDFDAKGIPAAAARLGQKIMDKITGAATTTATQPSVESVIPETSDTASSAWSTSTDAAKETAQSVVDSAIDALPPLDEVTDNASETMASVLEATSNIPSVSDVTASIQETMESITDGQGESAPSAAAESVTTKAEQLQGQASGSISSAYDHASSAISSGVPNVIPASTEPTLSSASSLARDGPETLPTPPSSAADILLSSVSSLSSALTDEIFAKINAVKQQFPIIGGSSAGVLESGSSIASSALSSGAAAVSSTVAPSASAVGEDIVDKVYAASRSLQSRFSEAGDRAAEVTESLMAGQ